MTEPMAAHARSGASAVGLANVEVRRGDAVALPVDTESADVVISNGVLNLVPEKEEMAIHLFVLMLEDRSFDHMLGFADLKGTPVCRPTLTTSSSQKAPFLGSATQTVKDCHGII